MNKVAYYLISTVTDDAGVVIQPALISLKNSKEGDSPANVRQIKLKGSNINLDKKITKVQSEKTGKSLVTDVNGDISTTKDTAIASDHDLITFEIETQLPIYDAKVTPEMLLGKVTLTDTPEYGVALTDSNANWFGEGIKIYPQAATGNAYSETPLVVNQDYTLSAPAVGGGFTITFAENALCYGSSNAPEGATGASTSSKLQGQRIKVVFQGKIDNDVNKGVSSEDKAKTYATLGTADEIQKVRDMLDYANSLKMNNPTKYAAALGAANDGTNGINSTAEAAIAGLLHPATGEGGSAVPAATTLTNEEKVAAYLALDKIHTAGDENKAVLKYGNQYSTGKHDVEIEDRVKLFTVDLDLTKIAYQLLIEEDSTTESLDYQVKDDAASTKKKVKNAVLELKKLNDAAGTDADKLSEAESCGLAITDECGKLWMLEKNSAAENPDYTDGNGQKWTRSTTNKAWQNLKAGTYQLQEVKAPTGYKTFDTFTFVITADTTGSEYNGIFSAGTFTPSTQGKSINDILLDNEGTPGGLTFVNGVAAAGAGDDHDTNNGELKGEVIDPPVDTLPATGGIGTVLFTAGGIAVVMMAGALFVIYMKKRSTEDEE